MKYLKLFDLDDDYQAFVKGDEFITPNVSYTKDTQISYFNPVPKPVDYSTQYLTFTALEDGMTVSFGKNATGTLNYSIDEGNTWSVLASNVATPSINTGEKIMFKGDLMNQISGSNISGIGVYSATKKFDISGNIMSLLYGDDFVGQTDLTYKGFIFYYLFRNCTKVVNAKDLILPATTLASYCYWNMFQGCTGLTTAPELPATTLEMGCYGSMFSGCTSLNYIKMLATDISATSCLDTWVKGVSSTGTFIKSAGVEIPTGNNGIPSGWTVEEV